MPVVAADDVSAASQHVLSAVSTDTPTIGRALNTPLGKLGDVMFPKYSPLV